MTHTPDSSSKSGSDFFRCPVASDNRSATIQIGRRRLSSDVQETSIDGFTVMVSPKNSSKLKVGRPWILHYDGTSVEVHPQWMFNSPDGHVQLGLRRLRDLTKPPKIKRPAGSWFGHSRSGDPSNSAVAFGGFVMTLFLVMALPGLGDRLGTSNRIQGTVRWIASELTQSFGRYF